MELPQVRHVKCSFSIDRSVLKHAVDRISINHEMRVKRFHNFNVIRGGGEGFVYTAFHSGHVNVVGIKCVGDIDEVVDTFCKQLDLAPNGLCSPIRVDNITASGTFGHRINLVHILEEEPIEETIIKFRPSFFPGMSIKHEPYGSMILFNSGAFSIVGAKKIDHINKIFSKVCTIVNA